MPNDINYQYGNGKLGLYSDGLIRDGNCYFIGLTGGGAGINTDNDNIGP